MKNLLRSVFTVATLLATVTISTAATYYSFTAGDFSTRTNWSTVAPPAAQIVPASAPTFADQVTITHAMTLASNGYTQWGGTGSITINNGGSLTRTGALNLTGSGINVIVNSGGIFKVTTDLTLSGNGNKVTVNSGGTLETTGTLTMDQNARIDMAGTVKSGSFTMLDNVNAQLNYTTGATFQITGASGSFNIGAGTGNVFGYTPSFSIPGAVTIKNGGTVNASGVNGAITLTNTSTLNLSTAGTISPTSYNISGNSQLTISGGTINSSTVDLSIPSGSSVTLTSGTLNVKGLSVSGTFNRTAGTLGVSTDLTVANSGTFTYTPSISVPGNINISSNTTGTAVTATNVGGTITVGGVSKLTVANTGTISPSSITMSNSGELVYSGGTLNYAGTLTLGTGNKLTVTSGTMNVNTLTSGGTVSVTGGTLNVTNAITVSGNSFTQSSGTVTAGSVSLTGGTTNINGGTLTSSGAFAVSGGAFTSASGSTISSASINMNNSGSSSFSNAGSFTVTGTGTATFAKDASNSGTLKVGGDFNSTGGTFTNTGTLTVTGNASVTSSMNNSGPMSVGGNFTKANTAGVFTNSGPLIVTGNVAANGKIQLNPGVTEDYSRMIVGGSVTVTASENLVVGTNVNPPPHADLIIKQNLIMTGSGDVTVNKNGRFAVGGNVTDSGGGGTKLTISDGGQMYVDGNVNFTGNGSDVVNNNATSPYGLYVNGTSSANTAQGGSITPNKGDKTTMQNTNPTFSNWVTTGLSAPLPITLSFFRLKDITEEGITLEWATATELNFDHFNLQRSANGRDFETIAEIQGHGTTKDSHNYSFTDKMALSGTSYYRLQSVDFDEYTETFNVVSVKYETGKSATVYPNPVTDSNVSFRLNFVPANEILVTITSVSGVERVRGIIMANETDVSLGISLEPGVYIVKLASIDFNKVSRIVVK